MVDIYNCDDYYYDDEYEPNGLIQLEQSVSQKPDTDQYYEYYYENIVNPPNQQQCDFKQQNFVITPPFGWDEMKHSYQSSAINDNTYIFNGTSIPQWTLVLNVYKSILSELLHTSNNVSETKKCEEESNNDRDCNRKNRFRFKPKLPSLITSTLV